MRTKTKNKVTPGPWEIEEGLYGEKGGLTIWGTMEINECGHQVHGFVGYVGKCDDIEQQNNARLIAAAPELLEALENIVSFGEASEWDKAITGRQILLADAQAAIRKARGE